MATVWLRCELKARHADPRAAAGGGEKDRGAERAEDRWPWQVRVGGRAGEQARDKQSERLEENQEPWLP